MIKSSKLSAIFLSSLALALPFTAAQGAYLKNGVLNFAIGEKEDPAQSNTYVKVVKRTDGSAQVFYYDPDAGNKFVQKTIPAGQTLKISYWNSSGQRIKQEIRTSGEAAAPEIASTPKAQPRPRSSSSPKESADSSKMTSDSGSSMPDSVPEKSTEPLNTPSSSINSAPEISPPPPPPPQTPPPSAATPPASPINQNNSANENPIQAKGEAPIASNSKTPAKAPLESEKVEASTRPEGAQASSNPETTNPPAKADDSDPFADSDEAAPQLSKSVSEFSLSKTASASTSAPASTEPASSSAATPAPIGTPAATPSTEPSSTPASSAAEPAQTSASPPEQASVASADLPKFDPFALIPTMKSSPADTPATSPGSSSRAIMTPVATAGDSFIKATDTNLGPCVWRKFPIKVYMDPAPGATAAQLESEVREAFDIWTKVTGNKIRFAFGAKQGADITITWTPTTAGFRDPSEAGESSVDYSTPPGPKRTWDNPGSITHAKVKLSTTDINHKEWQAGQFKLLVLHEIGHALGIFGHSDNANDIMYTLKGAPALSPRDINTVNILYKSVSGN